ncbi:MAG: hypothetical protein ACJAV2_002984, partial [Myxococcota bacterium]
MQLEAETGVRHELVDGLAYAMSGGTRRQSRLKARVVSEAERRL